ncbi:MAG: Lar family restriction alleviation protein [Clostridia bacterium]|nr:Lar family restriction alleviation protein [Clostridia bacterium]
MKNQSDLKHCPFCGITVSWKFEDDIVFSNVQYLTCRNCKAEISINKNSVKNDDLFFSENVFIVENVGGFNYAKISVRDNLTVNELNEKAIICQNKIEEIKQNKKKVLNLLINEQGEIINTPKTARLQDRKKKYRRAVLIVLGVILVFILLYLFV